MAKLLSFQKLFQKDHDNFLGVSKGPTEGQLVVTYNGNMVMLEDVSVCLVVSRGYFLTKKLFYRSRIRRGSRHGPWRASQS